MGQFHTTVDSSKIHSICCLLASFKFIQQSQLFDLEEGQIDRQHIAVHLEHGPVELEIPAARVRRGQTFNRIEIGKQPLDGLVTLTEVLISDLDVFDQICSSLKARPVGIGSLKENYTHTVQCASLVYGTDV